MKLHPGTYFGLNAVGARVWDLLAAGKSLDAIVETCLAEFEVDAATLRRDIERLVAELEAKALVVRIA